MKTALKIGIMFVFCSSLMACTVAVQPDTGRCSVHDYKGRKWAAAGSQACHIALQRCRHWHQKHHPNADWACMYK